MRLLVFVCLGGLLASGAADYIQVVNDYDVEPALKDETKWKVIFHCFMDSGPCGKFQAVKDGVIRIYNSKCEKCTPQQKDKFESTLKRIIETYPDYVAKILAKVSTV